MSVDTGRLPPAVQVSEEALEVLRAHSGPLTTTVGRHLEEQLSWYKQLSTEERASLSTGCRTLPPGRCRWSTSCSDRHRPI